MTKNSRGTQALYYAGHYLQWLPQAKDGSVAVTGIPAIHTLLLVCDDGDPHTLKVTVCKCQENVAFSWNGPPFSDLLLVAATALRDGSPCWSNGKKRRLHI